MAAGDDRRFFGHPIGLAVLLLTEFGWAFAYYGLQTMLTLYMTQHLLHVGHVEHVWGLKAFRRLLSGLYGPMSDQAFASQTFGLATSLIYALPLLGGFLADRWLGQRTAVTVGVVTLAVAHLLFVTEPGFLVALGLMVIGTGFLKTSLVGQIGRLYAQGDDRRPRAFGLYLIALNAGSLASPLIAGTLSERLSWPSGLAALAGGMGFGAVIYILGRRFTPADHRGESVSTGAAPAAAPAKSGAMIAIIALILADALGIGIYNQAWNVLTVWAEARVDRSVFGFQLPVTWLGVIDGVLTIVGTALAVRLWRMSRRPPGGWTDLSRILFGLALNGAGFLLLAAATLAAGPFKTPLFQVFLFFVLVDFGTPWSDTVTLNVISRDSPLRLQSTMLGVYYLAIAFANFGTGQLGVLASVLPMSTFWFIHAAIGLAIVLALGLGGRWLVGRIGATASAPSTSAAR